MASSDFDPQQYRDANERDRGLIPSDLAGIDRLLASSLRLPIASDAERLARERRLKRIFAASVEELASGVGSGVASGHDAVLASIGRRGSGSSVGWRSRTARLALAAAAALAFVGASWFAVRSGAFVSPSTSNDQRMADRLESETSPSEITLVALLETNSDQFDRFGGLGWVQSGISADALGGGAAARIAAPVLQTRGAAIDDFESELGEILGLERSSGRSPRHGSDGDTDILPNPRSL
jgi:hypothetical protein